MSNPEPVAPNSRQFVETDWCLVLRASPKGGTDKEALTRLCQLYWRPLFSYVRRRGFSHHDAEDITQGFFSHLLEKGALSAAEQSRGRFRAFLLASLRNYLLNQITRASAEKRGGKKEHLPLSDFDEVDDAAVMESPSLTPDQVYDRVWALSVLNIAAKQLEGDFATPDKIAWYRRVRPFLERRATSEEYDEIARDFSMTKNAVAVAVHRLQQRYQRCVRDTVAETVADRQDTDAELAEILASLGK